MHDDNVFGWRKLNNRWDYHLFIEKKDVENKRGIRMTQTTQLSALKLSFGV